MVQVNNEKMSKSLGNFFVIRDVLKTYAPEVVRYFLLSGHYRSEIHYSPQNLESAKGALTRFYHAREGLSLITYEAQQEPFLHVKSRFIAAMEDDLNTPEALAVLFDLVKDINRAKSEGNKFFAGQLVQFLVDLAAPLGLLQAAPADFLQGQVRDQDIATIKQLIAQRKAARDNKNFAESDRIRDELKAQGIELEDAKAGTTWRKI
jgi:cysteinyl-tRNA synthetase